VIKVNKVVIIILKIFDTVFVFNKCSYIFVQNAHLLIVGAALNEGTDVSSKFVALSKILCHNVHDVNVDTNTDMKGTSKP